MPVLSRHHPRVCAMLPMAPWVLSLVLVLVPVMAQAQPSARSARELVCQMRYGSETLVLRQSAGPDPYAAATVEVPDRFRLRAVVLGTPEQIEHITLTSYQLGEGQAPLILHQVRLDGPFATQRAVPDLTGWQHVYASDLGREMRFGCALLPASGQVQEPAAQVPK